MNKLRGVKTTASEESTNARQMNQSSIDLVTSLVLSIFFFSDMVVQRKLASTKKQNSSKILVRNVPFEASKKELKELFG